MVGTFKINNVDVNFPQMGKEPTMGYEPVYTEKTVISGAVFRKIKGYRRVLTWSYDYLTYEQRQTFYSILNNSTMGAYTVYCLFPAGHGLERSEITDTMIITMNSDQRQFMDSSVNGVVYKNWRFRAVSQELLTEVL